MIKLLDSHYTTIYNLLLSVLPRSWLRDTAKLTGFVLRLRGLRPELLVLAIFTMLERNCMVSIEGLYQRYQYVCSKLNYPCISDTAFYNQINKTQFEAFAEQVFTRLAKACFGFNSLTEVVELLEILQERGLDIVDIFATDGSDLRLRDGARKVKGQHLTCKGSGGISQKELHGTFSLIYQAMLRLTITNGVSSERAQIPTSELKNCVWLADAGYPDFDRFKEIAEQNSYFIVRGLQSMNPIVHSLIAYDAEGKVKHTVTLEKPPPLKQIAHLLDKTLSYDMEVELSNKFKCRVIRSYVPDTMRSDRHAKSKGKDGFAYFYTNFPREALDLKQVVAFYRLRWGIEIFWKALKSFNNLRSDRLLKDGVIHGMIFMCLAWVSLKVAVAQQVEPFLDGKKMSLLKVATYSGDTLIDLLYHLWQQDEEHPVPKADLKRLVMALSRCVKAKPSKINREQCRSVAYVIEELRREPRLRREEHAA